MSRQLWAALGAGLLMSAAGASLAEGLCKDGESVVFNCSIAKNGKLASVCLQGKSALSYRFGTAEKIELEYPGSETPAFKFHSEPYPDGIESTFSFARGSTGYSIIHQDGSNGAPSYAWVSVDRGGKNLARLDCAVPVVAGWAQIKGLLEGGDAKSAATPAAATTATTSTTATASTAATAAATTTATTAAAAAKTGCDAGPAPLSAYRKKLGDYFRNYAEKKHPFYKFAVSQFGAPTSCSLTIDTDQVIENGDAGHLNEHMFFGKLAYNFAGATLLFTNVDGIDARLSAADGFKDVPAASKALEKATRMQFKNETPTASEDAAAGTQIVTYVLSEEESATAELVTKAGKLISIDAR